MLRPVAARLRCLASGSRGVVGATAPRVWLSRLCRAPQCTHVSSRACSHTPHLPLRSRSSAASHANRQRSQPSCLSLHASMSTETSASHAQQNEREGTAFLFPGQGAQALQMTRNCEDIPRVAEMYTIAQDILGYDIKEVVMGEDKERLNQTDVCQPAMLIAGLAAVEKLRIDKPEAIASCRYTAGLSLGEYTALTFAECLSFESALSLVKLRGEMMQKASDMSKGTMLSVIGVDDSILESACAAAQEATDKVAVIANYLSTGIRVVSGDEAAVAHVKAAVEESAVKVAYLPVAGAFHTSLMAPAVSALRDAIANTEMKMPAISVFSNTLGRPYQSVAEIREQLVMQVASPVLWDKTLAAVADQAESIFELGPQRQIKSMMRKVNMAAFKKMKNVTV